MKGRTLRERPVDTAPDAGPRWRAIAAILAAALSCLALLVLIGRMEGSRTRQGQVLSFPASAFPDGSVNFVDLRPYQVHRYIHRYHNPYSGMDDIGGTGFYLVQQGDLVLALLARSTHLGESIVWQPEEGFFLEPAHSAIWDRLGRKLAGPAPRDLDWFPANLDGNEIRVDVSELYCSGDSVGYGCRPEKSKDPRPRRLLQLDPRPESEPPLR